MPLAVHPRALVVRDKFLVKHGLFSGELILTMPASGEKLVVEA
jgi:hypothetical protein